MRLPGKGVIGDREIWACAQHVLRRYGESAWLHAAQRADALLVQGDFAGSRTWVRILERIDALRSRAPEGPLH